MFNEGFKTLASDVTVLVEKVLLVGNVLRSRNKQVNRKQNRGSLDFKSICIIGAS